MNNFSLASGLFRTFSSFLLLQKVFPSFHMKIIDWEKVFLVLAENVHVDENFCWISVKSCWEISEWYGNDQNFFE